MNIFGIGPLELVFIIILLLIIFGPEDLQKAGKSMGKFLRNIVRSDTWKSVVQTSNSIKNLPNELIREAELEEIKKTISDTQNRIGEINREHGKDSPRASIPPVDEPKDLPKTKTIDEKVESQE